jgi:propanol-preferring alcohol dehydrogenase
MKAAVIHRFGQMPTIDEVPVPTPGTGQVLIRVVGCGVCHTDLYAIDPIWPVKPKLPLIPGHEVAGYIAAIGPGVTTFKEGDRVGAAWIHTACGFCEYCLTGTEMVCPQQEITGYSVNGGYAEYMLAQAAFVIRLPESLDFVEAAPILCAGVTPYRALKEAAIKAGEWVVISGIGGLGHLAVQYAKAMGLHVAAVDVVESKLALAREFGAERVINASITDPVKEARRQFGGAHAVLITAVSMTAFQQGVNMLRRNGTCVLVGLPSGDFTVSIHNLVAKRLTIRGSTVGTRKDLQEALQFAVEGRVRAVIERQPLEAIYGVLNRLRDGQVQGRVVLQLE